MICIPIALAVYTLFTAMAVRGLGHLVQLAGLRAAPDGRAWRIGDRMVWIGSYTIIGIGVAALAGLTR